MPNYTILDDTTIVYSVANSDKTIILIKDPNMIAGSARWDTLNTKNIYYNLPPYSKIIEIADTLSQIYHQYYEAGVFSSVPTPDSKLPKWSTYDPELQSFYIRFDYVMSISVDYSSIPTCKFYTSPHGSFKSLDYHYANTSIKEVCSEPQLVIKNQDISYCPYASNDIFGSMPQHNCSHYVADSEILKVINLTSKYSENNKLNITVSKSRMNFGKNIQILFHDEINNTTFHKISFDSLDQNQLNLITQNVEEIVDEIISSYKNDFVIESQDVFVEPVVIKKKSFISSLIEKEDINVYV